MKRFLKSVKPLYIASAILLVGCAAHAEEQPFKNGHLVIVGGGMARENNVLYGHIVELGGDNPKVGVIPTASGEPESSGPSYADDFKRWGLDSEVVDITTNNPEEASNQEKADQIRSKDILFFTGGVQSRIIEAFRPEAGDTVSYEACLEVLRNGGVIAGSSAGAAMMSDPCIYWGNSTEALLIGQSEGEDRGIKIGKGMGFFPYGLTGQHFMQRGRLGRLIVALEETGLKRGYGVDNNRGIAVDLASDTIRALGTRGLLYVDISDAERDGINRRGIRVSLLGGGDTVNGITGKVTPADGKNVRKNVGGIDESFDPVDDPWARYEIPEQMVRLASNPATEVILRDKFLDLRFYKDSETQFYQHQFTTFEVDPTIINMKLDILEREGAEAEAERLKKEIAEKKEAPRETE